MEVMWRKGQGDSTNLSWPLVLLHRKTIKDSHLRVKLCLANEKSSLAHPGFLSFTHESGLGAIKGLSVGSYQRPLMLALLSSQMVLTWNLRTKHGSPAIYSTCLELEKIWAAMTRTAPMERGRVRLHNMLQDLQYLQRRHPQLHNWWYGNGRRSQHASGHDSAALVSNSAVLLRRSKTTERVRGFTAAVSPAAVTFHSLTLPPPPFPLENQASSNNCSPRGGGTSRAAGCRSGRGS